MPKGLVLEWPPFPYLSLATNSSVPSIILPSLHFMVLGRLIHYAADAVLVSTVLAGIKRSSGFAWVPVLPDAVFQPDHECFSDQTPLLSLSLQCVQ